MVAVSAEEIAALSGKIADIERKIAQLDERHAEMTLRLQDFQLAQFRALGDVLAECLRLRYAVARRKAELSGDDDDQAAADAAARERADYEARLDGEEDAAESLDADAREELKRLYRNAAMRCHPDRVAEDDKALAQARFQQVQSAYRRGDLAGLRQLLRDLDATPLPGRLPADTGDADALRHTLSALRGRAADLILAIQTLQIDPDYRRALDEASWQAYFSDAQAGFEYECEALRQALARMR
ncbi:MAG: DnaJ domain-containing protein [Rhodocyclaceae bacterium]|nr:DnaJ domain-containing protein [Rhodocyclaceae bacterium]